MAEWERHAAWWQTHFSGDVDPEYAEQILPLIAQNLPPSGRVLDVGCGEGQVARLASAAGLKAFGVDLAMAQVTEARSRSGGPVYLRGSATALPVVTAGIDTAVACLVLEHLDDLDAALSEVARVLRPGGRFLLLLNHPLFQTPGSGWIDDQFVDPPEQYWRIGPYLEEAETVEEVDKDVFITFKHRPLSRYLNAAAERGLVLERMVEPAPPTGFLALADSYAEATTIPRLLFMRLRRL